MEVTPANHTTQMEVRRKESVTCYEEGYAVGFARGDFNSNPHKMVSWGDSGHKRPAWFDGYNAGLRSALGIKTAPQDEAVRDARNGHMGDLKRLGSYDEALALAAALTARFDFPFIAEDRGESCHPRFAVIQGWQIGEPVSYAFNGDYYPCGFITKMTERKIEATDHNGHVRAFFRRRLTGSWRHSGTWGLVHGWHNDQNPEF